MAENGGARGRAGDDEAAARAIHQARASKGVVMTSPSPSGMRQAIDRKPTEAGLQAVER